MSTGTVRREIERRTVWRLESKVGQHWVPNYERYDDPARPFGVIKSMNEDTRPNYRVVEETTIRTVIEG